MNPSNASSDELRKLREKIERCIPDVPFDSRPYAVDALVKVYQEHFAATECSDFNPNDARTWDKQQQEVYETGHREGESCEGASWTNMLDTEFDIEATTPDEAKAAIRALLAATKPAGYADCKLIEKGCREKGRCIGHPRTKPAIGKDINVPTKPAAQDVNDDSKYVSSASEEPEKLCKQVVEQDVSVAQNDQSVTDLPKTYSTGDMTDDMGEDETRQLILRLLKASGQLSTRQITNLVNLVNQEKAQARADQRAEDEKELIDYARLNVIHGTMSSDQLNVHGEFVPLAVIEHKNDIAHLTDPQEGK